MAIRGARMMPADSDSKITVTFTGGKGSDAPRIVLHANTIQELQDMIANAKNAPIPGPEL